MDHSDHNSHSQNTCPMIMMFHFGHCERILWKSWVVTTMMDFTLSCLAIFLIAFSYEGLKFFREILLYRSAQIATDPQGRMTPCTKVDFSKSCIQQIFTGQHLLQSILNFIQLTVSYLLMLVFMTFNYWLCLSVILGLTLGYFCFGWVKRNPYEIECCH